MKRMDKLRLLTFQVSLIYKDASLGNPVHITVVKILMLNGTEFAIRNPDSDDREKGKSASEMLRNFCKWQRIVNDANDASPYHHDTALLLTR